MTRTSFDRATVEICGSCESIWCTAAEFVESEVGLSVDLRRTEATQRSCPECRTALVAVVIAGRSGFAIEQCTSCHGFWFDGAEWHQVRSLSSEQDSRRDAARHRTERAEGMGVDDPVLQFLLALAGALWGVR